MVTSVLSLLATIPADWKPLKAMNMPTPAPTLFLTQSGTASTIFCCTWKTLSSMKMQPEVNTQANAFCHETPMPSTTLNAKKLFRPMAGPSANGKLPHRPIQMQAMAQEMAVAQNSARVSIPAAPRMLGFSTTMLTQDRKVVRPAMISVFTFVFLSVRWKNRSRRVIFLGSSSFFVSFSLCAPGSNFIIPVQA